MRSRQKISVVGVLQSDVVFSFALILKQIYVYLNGYKRGIISKSIVDEVDSVMLVPKRKTSCDIFVQLICIVYSFITIHFLSKPLIARFMFFYSTHKSCLPIYKSQNLFIGISLPMVLTWLHLSTLCHVLLLVGCKRGVYYHPSGHLGIPFQGDSLVCQNL